MVLIGLLSGCVVPIGADATKRATAEEGVVAVGHGHESPATDDATVLLPGARDGVLPQQRLTAAALQSEILAFADRYLEAIAEAADWGADHAAGLKARAAFRQTKVVYVTAAISTATEPDPLRALRDLMVLVALQRMVWESDGHAWAEAPARERMASALARLDAQLGRLAALVFGDAEVAATIRALTLAWHDANPERRYVSFVRFHDLEDSELKHRFDERTTHSGLLAPVSVATAEIHEMRRVAERALFLANHMPMLMEWQGEAYTQNLLKLPEIQSLFSDVDRFAVTAANFALQMERLPDQIARERSLALNQFAEHLQDQRAGALEQFSAVMREQREAILTDLEKASGSVAPLAHDLALASTGLRDTLTLAANLQGQPSQGDFTLAGLDNSVRGMIELTNNTGKTVRELQALMRAGESSAPALARLDAALIAHERRLFLYALALVVVAGSMLCLAALIMRQRTAKGTLRGQAP